MEDKIYILAMLNLICEKLGIEMEDVHEKAEEIEAK